MSRITRIAFSGCTLSFLALAITMMAGQAVAGLARSAPSGSATERPIHTTGVTPRTDFNGDGWADLAIGVSGEDVGSAVNAGGVNVIYGYNIGLSPTGVWDQFWSQDSENVEATSEAGDAFGSALATGDFNRDGRSDLAIGVPGEDIGSIADAGSVNVIYGGLFGLSATAVLADQTWDQNTASVDGESESLDNFGASLAAGDFNRDGFADLAIGVPDEAIGSVRYAGMVNVLYGSSSGLSATLVRTDQVFHQDTSGVDDAAEYGDEFGDAMNSGDFNGDGFSDLAIGVPGESLNNRAAAGALAVLYGSATGLATTPISDQFWTQDTANVEDYAGTSDDFGLAVAAGDYNGDGFSDLSIGTLEDAVNVLYGSSVGLSATVIPDQFWTQNSTGVEGERPQNCSFCSDSFGEALAAGDFNGDQRSDLAIGAATESTDGFSVTKNAAGAVNVLYGSSAGLSAKAIPDQLWTQDSSGIEGTASPNELFGYAVATGDFNSDGRSDLGIGVPYDELSRAGAVNVVYGSTAGLSATYVPDQLWTQNSQYVDDVAEPDDSFGASLSSS